MLTLENTVASLSKDEAQDIIHSAKDLTESEKIKLVDMGWYRDSKGGMWPPTKGDIISFPIKKSDLMPKENPINQTNLAIAALSASFANAMNKIDPQFSTLFLEEIENRYHELREMELVHVEAMETLTWTREFIQNK